MQAAVFNAVFQLVGVDQKDVGMLGRMYMAHSGMWRCNRRHANEVAAFWDRLYDYWVGRAGGPPMSAGMAGDMARPWVVGADLRWPDSD